MGRIERDRELARRRKRKTKLTKLREKYAKAGSRAEKEAIAEKVRKISPLTRLEEPEQAQT